MIFNFKVIVESIKDPDDNFRSNTEALIGLENLDLCFLPSLDFPNVQIKGIKSEKFGYMHSDRLKT